MNRKLIKCLFATIVSLALVVSVCPQIPAQAKQTSVTVSTQKELNAAIKNPEILKINIKTPEKLTLNIKGSASAKPTIAVTAPNANISVNTGVSAVSIKSASSLNLGAKAEVPKISITDPDELMLKLKKGASVDNILIMESANTNKAKMLEIVNNGSINNLKVNDDDSKVSVTNNNSIGKILLGAPAELNVSGKSDSSTPVTVKKAAAGAVVSASTGIKLNAYAPADVNLQKGAGKSTITVKNGNAELNVSNNTKKDISIKDQASGVSTKVESGATMSGEEIKNSVSSEIAKAEAEKKAAEKAAEDEAAKKAAEEEAAKKAAEEASRNSGGGSSVTPAPTPAPSTYDKTEEIEGWRTVTTYRVSDDKKVMEKEYAVSGEIVFLFTQKEWTYSNDAFIEYIIAYSTDTPGVVRQEKMNVYKTEEDVNPRYIYSVAYSGDVVTDVERTDYEDSHVIHVSYNTYNGEKKVTDTVYGTSLSDGAPFTSEQRYEYTGTVKQISRPENLDKNTMAEFVQSFYEAGNPVRTSGEMIEFFDSASYLMKAKYYYTYHSDGTKVKTQIKETYTTENQTFPATKTVSEMNELGLITSYSEYKNGNITKAMTVVYNDHNQISRIAEQDYSETIADKCLKEVVEEYNRIYREDGKLSKVTAVTTTKTATGASLNAFINEKEKTCKEYSYFESSYDSQQRIHVVTEFEWKDPDNDDTKRQVKKLTVEEYYGTTETYKKATVEETSYNTTQAGNVTLTYEITYDEQGHEISKTLKNQGPNSTIG